MAGTGFIATTDAFWGAEWVEHVREVAADLTILLVGRHVADVLVTSLDRRENLVGSMITGRKRRDDWIPGTRLCGLTYWRCFCRPSMSRWTSDL